MEGDKACAVMWMQEGLAIWPVLLPNGHCQVQLHQGGRQMPVPIALGEKWACFQGRPHGNVSLSSVMEDNCDINVIHLGKS